MSVRVTSTAGFDALSRELDDGAEEALFEVGVVAEGQIKERITKTVDRAGHRGRVQSGTSLQAVTARAPRRTSTGWRQVTEFQAPQDKVGGIIEDGRRKGPVSLAGRTRIQRWAKLKLRIPAKEIKSVGFLIARKIARVGFPGIHPFRNTAGQLRRGQAVRIFKAALLRRRGNA